MMKGGDWRDRDQDHEIEFNVTRSRKEIDQKKQNTKEKKKRGGGTLKGRGEMTSLKKQRGKAAFLPLDEKAEARDRRGDDEEEEGGGGGKKYVSDEREAKWFSILFFSFLNPLLSLGRKRPLEHDDVPPLCDDYQPAFCTKQLEDDLQLDREVSLFHQQHQQQTLGQDQDSNHREIPSLDSEEGEKRENNLQDDSSDLLFDLSDETEEKDRERRGEREIESATKKKEGSRGKTVQRLVEWTSRKREKVFGKGLKLLWRMMNGGFRRKIYMAGVFKFIGDMTALLPPLFLKQILLTLSLDSSQPTDDQSFFSFDWISSSSSICYLYVFLIFAVNLLSTVSLQQHHYLVMATAMKCRFRFI